MNRRKFSSKPWIFVPLNFKDYHWTFVALLFITYLNVEQDKKFTGYMYVDSFKYDLKDNETEQILIKKGLFNFINYANMMYGKSNRVQYTNLYNLLMDNDRLTRIHVPNVDESTQADHQRSQIVKSNKIWIGKTKLFHVLLTFFVAEL